MTYFSEKNYEKINTLENPLQKGEYDCCVFKNCNFSGGDFSEISFCECEFIDCDLSLVKLNETALRNVKFKNSKMIGVNFENINNFGIHISFQQCNLSHSIFYRKDIRKTVFKECIIHEADFAEANLSQSVFYKSDLSDAIFENTNLEKVDFREAFNFRINPEMNRIKKAKFSAEHLSGLLQQYDIEIF